MKGHRIDYTDEQLAFVSRRRRMERKRLHALFVARWPRLNLSLENLKALCTRRHWNNGRDGRFKKGQVAFNKGKKVKPHPNSKRTQFKKGQLPHNTKFAGAERVSKDGYVEISINERNPHTGYERRYVLKHRHLWEQAHGPVPKGMALKCKTVKTNCDPSNWELIPRSLLPRLNGRWGPSYDDAPPELKPAIMARAKLQQAIADRKEKS